MKYFTLQKWIDDQDIDSIDKDKIVRNIKSYQSYIESVRHLLPSDFLPLLSTYTIHDSNLRELTIDPAAKSAKMLLDCDDIETHNLLEVTLTYEGLVRFASSADPERGLPGPYGYGDLGNDEIKVLPDGTYEHRIIWSSGIEMAIQFTQFSLSVIKPA